VNPYEKLCNKDPRNPLFSDLYGYEDETPIPRGDCACDNCFYGRDAMALVILSYQEVLEGVYATPKGYQDVCWNLAADALGKPRPH